MMTKPNAIGVSAKLTITCLVMTCCVKCQGETNQCSRRTIVFSLSPVHLRAEPAKPAPKLEGPDKASQVTAGLGVPVGMQLAYSDVAINSRIFRSDQFYLSQNLHAEVSPGEQFLSTVFTPEVFRLKKVAIKCPIATAIKRKNPLALLSGLATDPEHASIAFRILELDW